jgi:hypothetical protein
LGIIVIQYEPGTTYPDGATNTDFSGSAAALQAKLKAGGGTVDMKTVSKHKKLNDVLTELASGGKACCKRIRIFGHGYGSDGALQLPYAAWDDDETPDKPFHLGGSGLAKADGQKAFDAFIAALKSALCPVKPGDPNTAQVTFDSCWSGDPGKESPIAKEVAKNGIKTTGYAGQVKFPYTAPKDDDTNRTYGPPEPEHAGESNTFDSPKSDAPKK